MFLIRKYTLSVQFYGDKVTFTNETFNNDAPCYTLLFIQFSHLSRDFLNFYNFDSITIFYICLNI